MGERHLIDEIMKLKYPAWVTGMTGDEMIALIRRDCDEGNCS
jgi:hypothetical protein